MPARKRGRKYAFRGRVIAFNGLLFRNLLMLKELWSFCSLGKIPRDFFCKTYCMFYIFCLYLRKFELNEFWLGKRWFCTRLWMQRHLAGHTVPTQSRFFRFLILLLLNFLVQHFFFLRRKLIYRLGHAQTSLVATHAPYVILGAKRRGSRGAFTPHVILGAKRRGSRGAFTPHVILGAKRRGSRGAFILEFN